MQFIKAGTFFKHYQIQLSSTKSQWQHWRLSSLIKMRKFQISSHLEVDRKRVSKYKNFRRSMINKNKNHWPETTFGELLSMDDGWIWHLTVILYHDWSNALPNVGWELPCVRNPCYLEWCLDKLQAPILSPQSSPVWWQGTVCVESAGFHIPRPIYNLKQGWSWWNVDL